MDFSLVPWQNGKALCWDVTVICPLADSYISAADRDAEAAAELAAPRKEVKYAGLDGRYMFVLELTMGQWVMSHGSNGSTNLGGLRICTREPLCHD